ncbi:MAG: hypothetical protein ACOX56_01595 [Acholeplasmataceae bacterium]|jgi:hypothetical protein
MKNFKRQYKVKSFILVLATVIFGFVLMNIGNVIRNNPPKNRDYLIYLYGEIHADEKISKKELKLWHDFYHNHGMRHLFIESAYFDSEILNLWMKADDDYYLQYLFDGWEGTLSHNQETWDFYVAIKTNYPETIFHGTDVGHQYERAGQFYLDYLEANGLKDTEKYEITLESIRQGEHFEATGDMQYRESKMFENFVREYDKLNGEKIMGIYGSAHIRQDIIGILIGVEPFTYRLKKHYGKAVYAKQLDKL